MPTNIAVDFEDEAGFELLAELETRFNDSNAIEFCSSDSLLSVYNSIESELQRRGVMGV